MKKTPASLRADAALIRSDCARMLCRAEQMEREANALEEKEREHEEARETANAELARMFFDWARKVRVCH